ncbi:MAG: hypothetical protein AABY22_17530 [Nanoarchaeota archaeon]
MGLLNKIVNYVHKSNVFRVLDFGSSKSPNKTKGLFDFRKEVVGTVEDYRKQTGYSEKITRADNLENLAVNIELQRRVYEAEDRMEMANGLARDYKPILNIFKNRWNEEKKSIYTGDFKRLVLEYVNVKYGHEMNKEQIREEYKKLMDRCKEKGKNASEGTMIELEEKIKRCIVEMKKKKEELNICNYKDEAGARYKQGSKAAQVLENRVWRRKEYPWSRHKIFEAA